MIYVAAVFSSGPNCLLSTCLIDNRAFVGEGCIILEHSWVAEYAMLAPGSVLQPFSYIPPGQVRDTQANPNRSTNRSAFLSRDTRIERGASSSLIWIYF